MGRGALSIAGFCDYAAIGRTAAFDEIRSGRLIAHKRGRSTIILIEDADAWLQSLPLVRPEKSEQTAAQPKSVKTGGAKMTAEQFRRDQRELQRSSLTKALPRRVGTRWISSAQHGLTSRRHLFVGSPTRRSTP